MSTPAQVKANRTNAKLSTGPATPAGIDICRFNATKHGLTGKQIVIRGEDPDAYDSLRQSLLDEYRPATEMEAMLVDDIAANWWRMIRARRYEASETDSLGGMCYYNEGYRAFLRQLARVENNWAKAKRQLEQLQKDRKSAESEALKEIGSVSTASTPPPSEPTPTGSELATDHWPLTTNAASNSPLATRHSALAAPLAARQSPPTPAASV